MKRQNITIEEQVIAAAEQYGFNLEFKTGKRVEEGFICE